MDKRNASAYLGLNERNSYIKRKTTAYLFSAVSQEWQDNSQESGHLQRKLTGLKATMFTTNSKKRNPDCFKAVRVLFVMGSFTH
ncbi:hypothetical protein [Bacillus timonensis]|uniref:hypothetical protein n=1 Tax=Bacillus timonensis TaxID=1033734 RepID=UPI000287B341|nr:hypothetical protein [Bacillus timonensis]